MSDRPARPLRILTWHVHGNYLYYLSQCPHEWYLPVKRDGEPGYGGRVPGFPWPDRVYDVPAEEVKHLDLDCVLFQSKQNYVTDQYEILSESQRRLPRIYLEHDPPREHPTDTRHIVDDPSVLVVHVTHFNALMWNCGRSPTRVIEHGVVVPEQIQYTGELARGVTVVNMLKERGRRVGSDVFDRVRADIPLDLIGMRSEQAGGLGEIPHDELPAVLARYRFMFNPIRYTSLGLAVCEAMSLGVPVIALATTEMVTVVENDVSGYVDTDVSKLIARMRELLEDPVKARRLGEGARRQAHDRFGIDRFCRNWDETFSQVTGRMPRSGAVDLGAAATSCL